MIGEGPAGVARAVRNGWLAETAGQPDRTSAFSLGIAGLQGTPALPADPWNESDVSVLSL